MLKYYWFNYEKTIERLIAYDNIVQSIRHYSISSPNYHKPYYIPPPYISWRKYCYYIKMFALLIFQCFLIPKLEVYMYAAYSASLFSTISRNLLKLISIESVMPSNHLILCHPLLLVPSIFPGIRVFSNELSFSTRWPKYWTWNFSISAFNKYSGSISFRIDCFYLLAL